MKEKWFHAIYKPYVTIGKRKHYTANVSLHLPAKNRNIAMKRTIATLQEQGYKYAKWNKKYIKLKKVI
jgi:hypothetical protein